MSYADQIFIDMCRDIIENGTSTEGEKVRPKWEDGSFAYTIQTVWRGEPLRSLKRISGSDPAQNRA